MDHVIEKKQLRKWLSVLGSKFNVIDVRSNVLPFKKYLFLPWEEIFKLNRQTGELKAASYRKDLLLFGLDLADLKALVYLDQIMKTPDPDFYYWQRRERAVVVGLIDVSVDLPPGGDLILEKISGKYYRALPVSPRGKALLSSSLFKSVKVKPRRYAAKRDKLKELLQDAELLSQAVAWSVGHKVWDELAEQCLGCGVCTYACPICHCFSLEDRMALDGQTCTRCRYWDACTLPGFARVAGGHNFHKSLKERYYNWFYHKFVRAYREYGQPQCVACQRCRDQCPAGIDIEKILSKIVGDYRKTQS